MKIIHETDTLVFGQEEDQVRALGLTVILGCLTAEYGGTKLFTFAESVRSPISTGQYGILYERADAKAVSLMPVAFVTWAYLSKAAEVVFSNWLRPLHPTEWKCGPHFWLMDLVAPLGHAKELQIAIGETVGADYEEYHRMTSSNGKMRRGKLRNVTKRGHKDLPE